MGRVKKNEGQQVNPADTQLQGAEPATKPQGTEAVPANVERLMKFYPQYAEIYVTEKGFVHPAGTPEYIVKGAKLYKNKYFNK